MNRPNYSGNNEHTHENIEKYAPSRTTTLVYVFNPEGDMLLATKKTTNSEFNVALEKVNTAGGKKEGTESIEDCALRELEDEFGIIASQSQLIPVGKLRFHFETKANRDQDCYVYKIINYTGTFKDSTEMVDIAYHKINNLPYQKMRESDTQRLPDMLAGKEINDIFYHTDDAKVLNRRTLEHPDENTRLLQWTA